jgi:hypothetical protein
MPRVSVIIPTYNRAGLVVKAIRSVQAQTYPDVEIIVVDDASTDGTCDVVREFAARDPRIKLVRQPENRDVQAARNTGVAHATGSFVNFLDSDDLLAPDKLKKQLALFEQYTDLDMVISQSLMFYETPGDTDFVWGPLGSGLVDYRDVLTALLRRTMNWAVLAPLYRRDFLDRLLPLPEDLTVSDDRELQIRAICHAPRLALTPEALDYVRIHHDTGTHESSKGHLFDQPHALQAQLRARQSMWRHIRDAGLDTAENRANLVMSFVRLMRVLARKRRFAPALTAWRCAVRVMPDWRSKVKLAAVFPAVLVVSLTGLGGRWLFPLLHRSGLERPHEEQYLRYRYTEETT